MRFSGAREDRKQELAPTIDDASTIFIETPFFSILITGTAVIHTTGMPVDYSVIQESQKGD
ncbi:MAG: hypothetical protein C4576_21800 [Desulfobacteraceae bacterium]|nr:MAG: hypothetical protein C4576_21800 [Desulfobacteraceae bacterium]